MVIVHHRPSPAKLSPSVPAEHFQKIPHPHPHHPQRRWYHPYPQATVPVHPCKPLSKLSHIGAELTITNRNADYYLWVCNLIIFLLVAIWCCLKAKVQIFSIVSLVFRNSRKIQHHKRRFSRSLRRQTPSKWQSTHPKNPCQGKLGYSSHNYAVINPLSYAPENTTLIQTGQPHEQFAGYE